MYWRNKDKDIGGIKTGIDIDTAKGINQNSPVLHAVNAFFSVFSS